MHVPVLRVLYGIHEYLFIFNTVFSCLLCPAGLTPSGSTSAVVEIVWAFGLGLGLGLGLRARVSRIAKKKAPVLTIVKGHTKATFLSS